MSNEDFYVKKRKLKAGLISTMFFAARLFPINKRKIVFTSYEGDGGFGCNPRYIAEELHRQRNDIAMVWLTHDPGKNFPYYIKPIKDNIFNTIYHLSTAKVWIDNYRKPYGTLKRKRQYYIQTWHAAFGFKAVGLYRGKAFPKIARLVSEWDSKLIDYALSNSDYCDAIYPKKILYHGTMYRSGSPRCDCIINGRERMRKTIRERYHLPQDVYLVLYAPTFRAGDQNGKKIVAPNDVTLDFEAVRQALSGRFGGDWRFLLRLHPQLAAKMSQMPVKEKKDYLLDVSKADDISELMAASDMVITDYSSCAFDAGFCHIPVLLYADDIKDYVKSRGKFMWKREEIPFLIAETNTDLVKNIKQFELDKYNESINAFMKKYNVVEDGHASEKVADLVGKCMKI